MKFRFFIFSLIFSQTIVYSQVNIDTSLIRYDVLDQSRDIFLFDTLHGLTALAYSKNDIEIRFISIYEPFGSFEERVTSFDGKSWNGFILKDSRIKFDTLKSCVFPFDCKLISKEGFPIFISALEKAGLFGIRSLNEIELENHLAVFDGASYVILYKIGNKFRCIRFNNPEIFKEHNPRIKEFQQYMSLVKLFSSELIRE
jgi:hypothetical protein